MEPSAEILVDDQSYPDAPIALIEAAVVETLAAQGRRDVEISVALRCGD
jgi:hypothetical protein